MKILLHICCGVCAAGVASALSAEGHQITGFFYNPNIHPEAEHQRRLEAALLASKKLGFPIEVGPYTPQAWLSETEYLKDEPEGGRRCQVCYRLRLETTFAHLVSSGADAFTTTLTVSPHKPALVVNQIGQEIGGDKFLARDFKKKDGFKQAIQLARQWQIYRQDYCGCIYSMRQKEKS